MASLQIDKLSPGMVLKKNVTDRSGRLLLPSGTTLEPKHLNIFRMWGVLDVEVADQSEAETAPDLLVPELDPEVVARASAEVEGIFAHNDLEHPAVRELMRICIRRRAAHDA